MVAGNHDRADPSRGCSRVRLPDTLPRRIFETEEPHEIKLCFERAEFFLDICRRNLPCGNPDHPPTRLSLLIELSLCFRRHALAGAEDLLRSTALIKLIIARAPPDDDLRSAAVPQTPFPDDFRGG